MFLYVYFLRIIVLQGTNFDDKDCCKKSRSSGTRDKNFFTEEFLAAKVGGSVASNYSKVLFMFFSIYTYYGKSIVCPNV